MATKSLTYLYHFALKTISGLLLVLFFVTHAFAQNKPTDTNTNAIQFNPLLSAAFKKPLKTNPLLQEYIKPSKNELMYWPNFPLTAAQIEQRDRKYNRTIAGQIVDDIADSYLKSLLYGRPKKPASVPKF